MFDPVSPLVSHPVQTYLCPLLSPNNPRGYPSSFNLVVLLFKWPPFYILSACPVSPIHAVINFKLNLLLYPFLLKGCSHLHAISMYSSSRRPPPTTRKLRSLSRHIRAAVKCHKRVNLNYKNTASCSGWHSTTNYGSTTHLNTRAVLTEHPWSQGFVVQILVCHYDFFYSWFFFMIILFMHCRFWSKWYF